MSIFRNEDNNRLFNERIIKLYGRTNADDRSNREKDVVKLYDGVQYNRLLTSTKLQTKLEPESNPFESLRDLHRDTKLYLEQLETTESTGSAQRIVGKGHLNEQIDELRSMLQEIELYAKEKQISLDSNVSKSAEVFSKQVTSIKNKAKKFAEYTPTNPAPANEFLLSREIENERKMLLLKKAEVLSAKLNKVEALLGNKEAFKIKSLCAQFEEESNNLMLIDPVEINHIIKKLEVVVSELKRSSSERKMHYFAKEQKDELKAFLDDFFKGSDKPYIQNITGHVGKIVELVETNADAINEISEMTENLETMRQLIEKYTAQAKENGAVLANMKDQMGENAKQINDSLVMLKR
jgi:hypothetical protein